MADLTRELRSHFAALLPRRARIIVGVSGGLDSMVLARLLLDLAGEHDWQLIIAHFEHGLRRRAGAGDARFVARFAAAHQLPFATAKWPVAPRRRAVAEHGPEMAAREARFAFFGRVRKEHRARWLALAHHADDQAELVLLRALRGAGSAGLGGMKTIREFGPPLRLNVVRPLLNLRRRELEEFARERNLRHREDATNAHLDFDRNWVRAKLLPAVEERFPAVVSNLARTAELLTAEADCLDQLADAWLTRAVDDRKRDPFAQLHPALQRRVILIQLHRLHIAPAFEWVEQLRARPDTPLTAPGDRRIILRDGILDDCPASTSAVVHNDEPLMVALTGNSGRFAFAGKSFRWRRLASGRIPKSRSDEDEYFDADALGSEITLRHWRAGDRFRPIGLGRSAKLQDLFVNAKVPREERSRRILAVTAGGEIFWVEGLRIGEIARVTPATRTRWRLTRED